MNNVINLVLVLAVLAIVGLGCGGSKSTATTPTSNSITKAANSAEKPVPVDAKALTKAYDTNEVAADEAMKGQMVAVTGKVSNIAETFGEMTVQMEGYKDFGMSVMCGFDDSQRGNIARLKKGQTATMIGRVNGSTGGMYVDLTDCHL